MTLVQTYTGANKERSYDGDYMTAGRIAEKVVMTLLSNNPRVIEVDDFRELRAVHEYDVDIGIKTIDGSTFLAEIKYDKHLGVTGNVLFEILRINHTCHTDHACKLGWSPRTPAKWLFYFAAQINQVWRCRTDDLRRAFQIYTQDTRKQMRIDIVMTDKIKTTLNVLIPEKYCNGIFTKYDVPSVEDDE